MAAWTGERETACQPSTGNAANAAESLMEIHVEMRSADTDIGVEESTGPVESNSGTLGTVPDA
jgi:hypothetical protein